MLNSSKNRPENHFLLLQMLYPPTRALDTMDNEPSRSFHWAENMHSVEILRLSCLQYWTWHSYESVTFCLGYLVLASFKIHLSTKSSPVVPISVSPSVSRSGRTTTTSRCSGNDDVTPSSTRRCPSPFDCTQPNSYGSRVHDADARQQYKKSPPLVARSWTSAMSEYLRSPIGKRREIPGCYPSQARTSLEPVQHFHRFLHHPELTNLPRSKIKQHSK